jgi:hypothetical protein
MKLITLNHLKSPLKAVQLGYPLQIEVNEMQVIPLPHPFIEFLLRLLRQNVMLNSSDI